MRLIRMAPVIRFSLHRIWTWRGVTPHFSAASCTVIYPFTVAPHRRTLLKTHCYHYIRLNEAVKKFSRGRRRAVLIAVAVMLIFSIVLAGAADVPQPVSYTDGLVTAELAVDEVIDLYYHGGSYDSFHGFSREVDGRTAVFLYFDHTLRSDVLPDGEGHLCIGNGLLTDFETATYQVSREVDAVYYLVGDYLELPGLAQTEFEQAIADAVLVWER